MLYRFFIKSSLLVSVSNWALCFCNKVFDFIYPSVIISCMIFFSCFFLSLILLTNKSYPAEELVAKPFCAYWEVETNGRLFYFLFALASLLSFLFSSNLIYFFTNFLASLSGGEAFLTLKSRYLNWVFFPLTNAAFISSFVSN